MGGNWGEGEAGDGSRAGDDNRKRVRSAQRRVGPKARPTAGAPGPGPRVRVPSNKLLFDGKGSVKYQLPYSREAGL